MQHSLPYVAELGLSHPANDVHAVSVSIPTWKDTCDYEEGDVRVRNLLKIGYPRFVIHQNIERLANSVVERYARSTEKAMLFPRQADAQSCIEFIVARHPIAASLVRYLNFGPRNKPNASIIQPYMTAVLYPRDVWPIAKLFWQHTGAGISSRQSKFCEEALANGSMVCCSDPAMTSSQQDDYSSDNTADSTTGSDVTPVDSVQDLSPDVESSETAKTLVRKRIAGSLSSTLDLTYALAHPEQAEIVHHEDGFSVDDVYLYPGGMNAIFNLHQNLLRARGQLKVIIFGFPYVDTLMIARKWGPGCLFYGHGSDADLDDLEARLQSGERYLGLFCEFPTNPLLNTPNLKRIRHLADQYNFPVVIDETIGNFLNIHILPDADVVMTSLTKVFSGYCNVMAGSIVLNPTRKQFYTPLKAVFSTHYTDTLFAEDAICLERNSREFIPRTIKINTNAEMVCSLLQSHPKVKKVHYPKISPSRAYYDAYRLPHGGYGGLLSCTFHSVQDAEVFFDTLQIAKGPSLGTNFTMATPHVLTVYYKDLDFAARYGCEASLVRLTVGLEDGEDLRRVIAEALDAIP